LKKEKDIKVAVTGTVNGDNITVTKIEFAVRAASFWLLATSRRPRVSVAFA